MLFVRIFSKVFFLSSSLDVFSIFSRVASGTSTKKQVLLGSDFNSRDGFLYYPLLIPYRAIFHGLWEFVLIFRNDSGSVMDSRGPPDVSFASVLAPPARVGLFLFFLHTVLSYCMWQHMSRRYQTLFSKKMSVERSVVDADPVKYVHYWLSYGSGSSHI